MSELVLGQWPALRYLDLSQTCIAPAATAELKQAAWPLEILKLNDNMFLLGVMEELVQGKRPRLKQLDLQGNFLRTNSCAALAKAPWPLQHLHLGNNFIGEAADLTYCSSSRWLELQTLELAGNMLSPNAMEVLCRAD